MSLTGIVWLFGGGWAGGLVVVTAVLAVLGLLSIGATRVVLDQHIGDAEQPPPVEHLSPALRALVLDARILRARIDGECSIEAIRTELWMWIRDFDRLSDHDRRSLDAPGDVRVDQVREVVTQGPSRSIVADVATVSFELAVFEGATQRLARTPYR